MEKGNLIEAAMGALVLILAVSFLPFALTNSSLIRPRTELHTFTAKFGRAGGLNVGSDVRISGISVGRVIHMALDPQTYLAVISFEIPKTIFLPVDSVAGIVGNGLLAAKFLNLIPGGSDKNVAPGGTIHTAFREFRIFNWEFSF